LAPQLSVSPARLTFSLHVGCLLNPPPQTLTVQNTGGGSRSWQATIQNPTYLSIDMSSGTLGPSAAEQISVTASCKTAISTTDRINFSSNGGSFTVTVTITIL
jgi:hypothetical protein